MTKWVEGIVSALLIIALVFSLGIVFGWGVSHGLKGKVIAIAPLNAGGE